MKVKRWKCPRCHRPHLMRAGDTVTHRPLYTCGSCEYRVTYGIEGKDDDPVPSVHPDAKGKVTP